VDGGSVDGGSVDGGSVARGAAERGSVSIWVLACGALLLSVTLVATLRSLVVLGRHRAESAADLAALAAAGQIGISSAICPAAHRFAAENHAAVQACSVSLDPGGRSGTVVVRVAVLVELPIAGRRKVVASARAGRLAGPP